jgi:hypothetical protein
MVQKGSSRSGAFNLRLCATYQLFSHNLGHFLSKTLVKKGQNSDFSLNSESSLGRTKIFLGRRLDAPDLDSKKICLSNRYFALK